MWRKEYFDMPFAFRRILDASVDTSLSGTAINVLGILARDGDEQGMLVISYRNLADTLGLSVSAVQKGIALLLAHGYISREQTAPRQSAPSRFRILPASDTASSQ